MTREQITVALIVACAMFIQTLDSSTMGTALPAIAADLGVEPLRLSVAVTIKMLTLAVFMPVSGWLADRFGTRRVFFTATVIYGLASLGCASSGSVNELVGFRFLQGIGGAMMVPVSRLVMLRMVERSKLVEAMTWVTIPALLGTVMGPPLAGLLLTWSDWTAIFLLNLPFCLLCLLLGWFRLADFRLDATPGFDLRGFLLCAVGLVALLAGLDRLAHSGALSLDLLLIAAALAVLGLYIRHARRTPAPVIDLGLLTVPAYRAAVLGGFVFRSGQTAVPFLLPILFQSVYGWTPLQTGNVMFASAAGAFLVKFAAPGILKRFGFRRVLMLNGLLASIALAGAVAFEAASPAWLVMAILFICGWLRSLQYTALNVLTYSDLSERQVSLATGPSSMFQQVGEAVGVSSAALVAMLLSGPGGTMTATGFAFGVLFFGLWSAASLTIFRRLRPGDGASAALAGKE